MRTIVLIKRNGGYYPKGIIMSSDLPVIRVHIMLTCNDYTDMEMLACKPLSLN